MKDRKVFALMTLADIVKEMRGANVLYGANDSYRPMTRFEKALLNMYADRIEAAHKREIEHRAIIAGVYLAEAAEKEIKDENAKLRDAIDRIYKCVDNKHGVDVTSLVKAIIANTLEETK